MTSPSEHVFDHVMIDIETLSLHKHKALILSIGMIEFDPAPGAGLVIGRTSLIVPEVLPQIMLGRRVSIDTQQFWAKQPKSASDHWTLPRETCTLSETCSRVRAFCEGKSRVWAKGPQFDLCNLEGLAEDAGEKELWHYQAPRDVRTFINEAAQTRAVPVGDALDIVGVPHEPVHDCIVQATQVWSHHQG